MKHATILVAAALLGTASPASAQELPPPDSATMAESAARAALSYWEASTGGSAEQSVFIRNNSDRPVQITSYEVYECFNVARRTCRVVTPGPVVRPGKTITLVAIGRQRPNDRWSYRYRFNARFVPDSSAVVPP
jgi:hypothetical protein